MLRGNTVLKALCGHKWLARRWLHWSSHRVRSTFLEYFKSLNHQQVCSSPVIPWNDRSLTFVNAGMNQFKSVFLGEAQRPCARATSSQKCVRVGGKHNDLADVGADTYHHTFFEMLGSWSFGDYFKKEACHMAWRLLTEVYKLPASSLYVTYFKGDEALGLEADLEVKHIWKSIGIPEERILPFGMQDNFWEMGMFGPCGPCTEIHYDRLSRSHAGDRVNLGVEDLIELWNIVFIQYERLQDGSLRSLGTHYVDTGMGLERITAVLNNKSSNYDTDLFIPLFSSIEKMSGRPAYAGKFSDDGNCLDTAYRVLADHARMVTVALADGMFPQECYNLHHIIKRAISIGAKDFGFTSGTGGLPELACVVAESLGAAYPELHAQLPHICTILEHEEKSFYNIQKEVSRDWEEMVMKRPELQAVSGFHTPRIIEGVEEVLSHLEKWKTQDNKLPGDVAHKLYATYGFNLTLINELANVYGLVMDENGFQAALEEARERAREGQQKLYRGMEVNEDELVKKLHASQVPLTDDSAKYSYTKSQNQYIFPPVETSILSILKDGSQVEKAKGRGIVGIVMEVTNFYHEAGGQVGDTGMILTNDAKVIVHAVENVGGYLVHWGTLEGGEVAVGDRVVARICEEARLGCMSHHTATHLLNSAVKAITGISYQTSSRVTPNYFYLQLQTYESLTPDVLGQAEDMVKRWIAEKSPITRKTVGFQEMLKESGFTLIPGEVYPQTVHVITTHGQQDQDASLSSVEPCCGTHLLNTGDAGSFIIDNISKVGKNNTQIRGVCGEEAMRAESIAAAALNQLKEFETQFEERINAGVKERLLNLEKDINSWYSSIDDELLPFLARSKITEAVEDLGKCLKKSIRVDANVEMVNEVKDIMSKQSVGPITLLVKTDFGTSKPKLRQASKVAKNRAILLLVKSNGIIMGRCCLPEEVAGMGASAEEWLGCVKRVLGGEVEAPPGKSIQLVTNFRSPKLSPEHVQEKLQQALEASKEYINKFSWTTE